MAHMLGAAPHYQNMINPYTTICTGIWLQPRTHWAQAVCQHILRHPAGWAFILMNIRQYLDPLVGDGHLQPVVKADTAF
jgi:hypothetical protein